MATITINKAQVEREGGVVVLPIKEYERILGIPTYYLKGAEAKRLDKLVEEGIKEYREGKTISASSLTEALKKHGAKRKR